MAEWAMANKDVIAENVSGAVTALRDAFASIDWNLIGQGLSFVMDMLRGVAEVAKDAAEAIRLFPTSVNDMPWADAGAEVIQGAADWVPFAPDAPQAAGKEGASFREKMIRSAVGAGAVSEAEGQAAALGALGFGLSNITGKGPGGVFGAGAVKERQIGGPGFTANMGAAAAKPPSGEITIKVQSAPGTTAEVVKDTTPPAVKVEGTGRRSVGGKL
jgi:hypothetical protein